VIVSFQETLIKTFKSYGLLLQCLLNFYNCLLQWTFWTVFKVLVKWTFNAGTGWNQDEIYRNNAGFPEKCLHLCFEVEWKS